jgi:hypothetical protein
MWFVFFAIFLVISYALITMLYQQEHLDIAKLIEEAGGRKAAERTRPPTAKEMDASATLCEHARNAMAASDLTVATKCYAAAAVLNPRNADICIERAGIYYKLRYVGKCIAQCQQAIEIAETQKNEASRVGNDRAAAIYLASLIKAREYLAMVYLLDGDAAAADEQWEGISKLGVDPAKSKERVMKVQSGATAVRRRRKSATTGGGGGGSSRGASTSSPPNSTTASKPPESKKGGGSKKGAVQDFVATAAAAAAANSANSTKTATAAAAVARAAAKIATAASCNADEPIPPIPADSPLRSIEELLAFADSPAGKILTPGLAARIEASEKQREKDHAERERTSRFAGIPPKKKVLPSYLREMGGTADEPVPVDAAVNDDDNSSRTSGHEEDEALNLLPSREKVLEMMNSLDMTMPVLPDLKASAAAAATAADTTDTPKATAGVPEKKKTLKAKVAAAEPSPTILIDTAAMRTRCNDAIEKANELMIALLAGEKLTFDKTLRFPKELQVLDGTQLVLRRLSNETYNGAPCVPVEYNYDNGRIVVHITEGHLVGKKIRVKPINLLAVTSQDLNAIQKKAQEDSEQFLHAAFSNLAMDSKAASSAKLRLAAAQMGLSEDEAAHALSLLTQITPESAKDVARIIANAVPDQSLMAESVEMSLKGSTGAGIRYPYQTTTEPKIVDVDDDDQQLASDFIARATASISTSAAAADLLQDATLASAKPTEGCEVGKTIRLRGLTKDFYNGLEAVVCSGLVSGRVCVRIGKLAEMTPPRLAAPTDAAQIEGAEILVKPSNMEPISVTSSVKEPPAGLIGGLLSQIDDDEVIDEEDISFEDLLLQMKEEDENRGKPKGPRSPKAKSGGGEGDDAATTPEGGKKKKKKAGAGTATGGSETAANAATNAAALSALAAADGARGDRQKQIQLRRDAMDLKEKARTLSLQDVADYEVFVQTLVRTMEEDKVHIQRKYKMAEAKMKMGKDTKRVKSLAEEIDSLKRREKRYNTDVAFVNVEVERFHASPAFKLARGHVLDNFVELNGSWVNKKDIEEAQAPVDFESLLNEMKRG